MKNSSPNSLAEVRERQLIERMALDALGLSGIADKSPLDVRALAVVVFDLKAQVDALTAAKHR